MASEKSLTEKEVEVLSREINFIADKVRVEIKNKHFYDEYVSYKNDNPDSKINYLQFLLGDREDVDIIIRPIIELMLADRVNG